MAEAPRDMAVMEDVVRGVCGVVWGGAGVAASVGGDSAEEDDPLVVGAGVLGLDSGCVAYAGAALPALVNDTLSHVALMGVTNNWLYNMQLEALWTPIICRCARGSVHRLATG